MSPTSYLAAPSRDIKKTTLEYGGRRIRTFEAIATDLQSAPFGHSGIPPYKADIRTRTENLLITSQLLCQLSHIGISGRYRARTYDPLLVRQVLSQLS